MKMWLQIQKMSLQYYNNVPSCDCRPPWYYCLLDIVKLWLEQLITRIDPAGVNWMKMEWKPSDKSSNLSPELPKNITCKQNILGMKSGVARKNISLTNDMDWYERGEFSFEFTCSYMDFVCEKSIECKESRGFHI